MKQIEITISPTGQTKVETKGFTGSACRSASKFVEEALGQRLSEQLTSDYYQVEPAQQLAREGQG